MLRDDSRIRYEITYKASFKIIPSVKLGRISPGFAFGSLRTQSHWAGLKMFQTQAETLDILDEIMSDGTVCLMGRRP